MPVPLLSRPPRRRSLRGDEEGVEEVMGSLTLLIIFAVGSSTLVAFGYPALQSTATAATLQVTEQSFSAIDSVISRASLGRSPSQSVRVPLFDGDLEVSNESWLRVELRNTTSLVDCLNFTLNSLTYREPGGQEVSFEAGGLWRRYPGDAHAMLSPPEFHYDGATLTLPILQAGGNVSAGGKGAVTLRAERGPQPVSHFPTGTTTSSNCMSWTPPARVNPLNVSNISVTARSPHHKAWDTYFKTISGSTARNDVNKTATIYFTTNTSVSLQYGVGATDTLEVQNSAAVDSYNSDTGPWSTSGSSQGDILSNVAIEVENSANISGNAYTAGTITVKNTGKITGDTYGEVTLRNSGTVQGATYSPVSPVSFDSVDATVTSKLNTYQTTNDNTAGFGACSGYSGNTLDKSSGSCTVTTGNYYFTDWELGGGGGGTIAFDTSGGDINIALESGDFRVKQSGAITVTGGNPVKLYLGPDTEFRMENSASITTDANQRASRFQVWGHSSVDEVELENSAIFTGFIYAPGVETTIRNSVQFYGSAYGGEVTIENAQAVHFDRALQGLAAENTAQVQYLHITLTTLNFTAA